MSYQPIPKESPLRAPQHMPISTPQSIHHFIHTNRNPHLHEHHHESFLEEIARQECRLFSCKEHRTVTQQSLANSSLGSMNAIAANGNINEAGEQEPNNIDEHMEDNDEDIPDEVAERKRFHLLDFSSDEDENSLDSDDYSSDLNLDEELGREDGADDNSAEVEEIDELADDLSSDEDEHDDLLQVVGEHAPLNADYTNLNMIGFMQPPMPTVVSDDTNNGNGSQIVGGTNPSHQAVTSLLLKLANSENEPLIRADISWSLITSCDSLASLYPGNEMQDPQGARLLQGILRMDPPLEAVEIVLNTFPMSCLDMDGFFAACQFAHPTTSRRAKHDGNKKLHPLLLNARKASEDGKIDNVTAGLLKRGSFTDNSIDDDGYDSDDSDVGEVVKLVMHRTICARKLNNIAWGMLAFLGDARFSPSHAKLLLVHNPEALTDSRHGAFGVSPLDRMASG